MRPHLGCMSYIMAHHAFWHIIAQLPFSKCKMSARESAMTPALCRVYPPDINIMTGTRAILNVCHTVMSRSLTASALTRILQLHMPR